MTETQKLYLLIKDTNSNVSNLVYDLKVLRRKTAKTVAQFREMFARIDLSCDGIDDRSKSTIRKRVLKMKEKL